MADQASVLLPAPRAVLAGLIDAIAAPSAESSSTIASATRGDTHTRQKQIINGQRPLLAALHVLYPALTLPALDLLDRRRVVRWDGRRRRRQLDSSSSTSSSAGPPLYQIRGGNDRPHVVHLRAWHCTCAFFALQAAASMPDAAMPAATGVEARPDTGSDAGGRGQIPDQVSLAHLPLAFSTPPCKHLLACLLAEEWAALDEYVVAGEDHAAAETDAIGCSPETLAGIIAGVL
ncbi:Coproporphyrinogen-III oxidase [Sporothrix epigloea]|uniref:Coproporphyrinogen-III oxidase n=1 Tax=Sporothrix epigloea TaxID=1892477 RepID=A0ABP0DVN9_9PEZI